MVTLKTLTTGIEKHLKAAQMRERSMQSFLNKQVLEIYRNKQRTRWMTEGASESGRAWKPLNPVYKKIKLTQFAAYEGGGTKMLIAKGKLFKSVIGPGEGFRKIATPRSLHISTTVEYARFVDDERSFTEWSEKSVREMSKAVSDFLFKGILRGGK